MYKPLLVEVCKRSPFWLPCCIYISKRHDHATAHTRERWAPLKNTMRLFNIIFIAILMTSCTRSVDIEKGVQPLIGLQPLDGFDKNLMDTISNSLINIYGYRVVILENQRLPLHAFVRIKSPRYRADSLLRHLLKIKPDSIDYIMGLTNKDISTTKREHNGHIKQPETKYLDWGIFGLGFKPGRSCVISSYRIHDRDYAEFIERLTKICVHEFGHNLSLDHCQSEKCVMQDAAETIKTIDSVNIDLCTKCKRKINAAQQRV
jgi:archaemetzincin